MGDIHFPHHFGLILQKKTAFPDVRLTARTFPVGKQPNWRKPNMTSKKYVRLSEILTRIPVSKSTWWQWCKDGKAPRPIKLSARTTVWKEWEIDEFLESHEA